MYAQLDLLPLECGTATTETNLLPVDLPVLHDAEFHFHKLVLQETDQQAVTRNCQRAWRLPKAS